MQLAVFLARGPSRTCVGLTRRLQSRENGREIRSSLDVKAVQHLWPRERGSGNVDRHFAMLLANALAGISAGQTRSESVRDGGADMAGLFSWVSRIGLQAKLHILISLFYRPAIDDGPTSIVVS
jgi:hypothetical protein